MSKVEEDKVYLTTKQVQNDERFGWNQNTLYRMKTDGLIKVYKFFGDQKCYWLIDELKKAKNIKRGKTRKIQEFLDWKKIPGNSNNIPAYWTLNTSVGIATMVKLPGALDRYEVSLRGQRAVVWDLKQANKWVTTTTNKLILTEDRTLLPESNAENLEQALKEQ